MLAELIVAAVGVLRERGMLLELLLVFATINLEFR